MKTIKFFITLILFLGSMNLFATDRIVQESGGPGTYSSIAAAVTAAVDGDRILVVNKAGNLPWIENITVNKSLQFLCATNNTLFLVRGDYTIVPAVGRTVSIFGMDNETGNILATVDGPAGIRTSVNVVGCKLQVGGITFLKNNFKIVATGNQVSGSIQLYYGNVIGNYCGLDIIVNTDSNPTEDTLLIIGNKMSQITWSSTSHYFSIQNNWVGYIGGSNGIYFNGCKNSSAGINTIVNNTVYIVVSSSIYGIYFASIPVLTEINIFNNVVTNVWSGYVGIINANSPNVLVKHNYCESMVAANDGTNVVASILTTAFSNGIFNTGIDMGYPDFIYNDVNLSQNDVGAYGGSFFLNNFFPSHNDTYPTTQPRVYFVDMPRAIYQGNTLNVKADAYAR